MSKPQPRRKTRKILVAYIETVSDTIRQIYIWQLDPNQLAFGGEGTYFNSQDLIENNLSVKIAMEGAARFIKNTNVSGSVDTTPELIVWDQSQLDILQKYIDNLGTLVKKNIVLLQNRCYCVFKYNLVAQNFSPGEIAGIMGYEDTETFKQVARIALKMEIAFKKLSKDLKKSTPVTKNKDRVVKDDYAGEAMKLQQN